MLRLERERPACNERESAKKRLIGNQVDSSQTPVRVEATLIASGTLALQSLKIGSSTYPKLGIFTDV